MGAYLMSLSRVDTANGVFNANFWRWSVCPTEELQPLKTLEFASAVTTTGSLDSNLPRGNEFWSTRKITGTFRQDFSLKTYPFDKEPLLIKIEEGVLDTRDLVYVADAENSGMDPAVDLPGWQIKGFKVTGGEAMHPTTFGDPSLSGGDSRYASLDLMVDVERAHYGNLIKATFSIYIAALLALISLLIVDGRTSMAGGAMFATVLSFVSVDRIIGAHDGVYLLDQIHFVTLALIMAATVRGGSRCASWRMAATRKRCTVRICCGRRACWPAMWSST